MRTPAAVAALLAAILSPACTPGQRDLGVSFQGQTMGTTFTVRVDDPMPEERQAVIAELIRATLDGVDAAMSTYRPDSEISLLNRYASDEPFMLSAPTMLVLQTAMTLAERSGGAFDPTVGALVNAWGFGPVDNAAAEPSAAELTALSEHTGYAKIALDAATSSVRKLDHLVQVDLSAVAKGYAVDQVAVALRTVGLGRFMVEVGGEVRTAGTTAADQPWRIGIERPDAGAEEIQRLVPMVDLSMASSGNYRNFYVRGGRVSGHIIDPRTARPVDHEGASVSVIAEECLWADGYATALMVLGPEEGLRWAEAQGLAALFVVHEGDGSFVERPTAAFRSIAGMPVQ